MAKITMPFFQATSTKLPLTKEVVSVDGLRPAFSRPVLMTRNDVNQLTSPQPEPELEARARP